MNRQAVNVLGGLVVALVVVLGVLIGLLPRWQAADDARTQRDTVLRQNQMQQVAIAGLQQQQADLPQLSSDVAALQHQIPAASDLDEVITLAVRAVSDGAVLQSIQPAAAQPGASGTGSEGTVGTDGTDASGADTSATGSATSGLQQVPVTLTFAIRRPADAMGILDQLRRGPRLLAVDSTQVAGGGSNGGRANGRAASAYTLTVAARVFSYGGTTS